MPVANNGVTLGELDRKLDTVIRRLDELDSRYVNKELHDLQIESMSLRVNELEASRSKMLWGGFGFVGTTIAGVIAAFVSVHY